MPVTAMLEVSDYGMTTARFSVVLTITNQTDGEVAILNPDMGVPAPEARWSWSNDVYWISLLLSFHYLTISVTDENGRILPRNIIETWSTPALRIKHRLASGDSLELPIPIGIFYELERGRTYDIAVEYGDDELRVAARTRAAFRP